MKLILKRSGGFLGSTLPPVTVDTTKLPGAQQQHVEALVHAADFFALPATLMPTKPGPDRFQYELEICNDAGRSHCVTFGEETTSTSLLDLAHAIRKIVIR